jgi:hypothetical protein
VWCQLDCDRRSTQLTTLLLLLAMWDSTKHIGESLPATTCKQPSRLVRPKTPPASPRLAITNRTTSFSRNQSKGLPDLRMVHPSSGKNMLRPIKCIPTARQPSLILLKFHQLLKWTQRDNKAQQSKPFYLHFWSHNLELGRRTAS